MKHPIVALLFGGKSPEYEVSCRSAAALRDALLTAGYEVLPIGITREGVWYLFRGSPDRILCGNWENTPGLSQIWCGTGGSFFTDSGRLYRPDVVFPALHGAFCEDGRLQGYLDMMRIPYSSCGFVTSVITFDKAACKRALHGAGLNMAREILLDRHSQVDPDEVIGRLGLPLFVKPNASGSSFGVTKVKTREQLLPAVEAAFAERDHVLMEEGIDGREISCGVMIAGGKEYLFPITELVCQSEFFDYKAKYQGFSKEITPADLDERTVKKVNAMTLAAYKKLNCRGVVRIDFIVRDGEPYFIEVNTIPGMSAHSIIPQQAAAMGMSMSELFDLIIEETSQAQP